MTVPQSSRDVDVREALASIHSTMTNAEVMEKFKITPSGFADLLKQLFTHKLISEEDLVRRGIQFRVVSPPAAQEPAQPIPLVPHDSYHEGEEFLDTVELTELLSFKPAERSKPDQEPEATEQPDESDQNRPPRAKKGKFGISSLFRKTW
jgi:hypothetical protein